MIAAAHSRKRDAGFTLIEVLAALVIASVVMVASVALIHDVSFNFDRGTRTVSNADRLLLAVERLAADFASVRLVPQAGQGAGAMVAFAGQPTEVRFVAAGGAAAGPQGEEVVGLTVEQSDGITRLVRRRARWRGPRTAFADLRLGDPVQMLEGRINIAFAYASIAPDGAIAWNESWSGQPLLPRLVRLTLQDRESGAEIIPAPQFVLRADAPIACARPGANPGCLTGEKPKDSETSKEDKAATTVQAGEQR